ncbi:HTH-like domain-containing protein [Leisingera sp. ANG-DT]|uniref:HTH-like domain-containing protein n=1 Tax=Leisingera sp. ANG-DT TaxID=1577897 RepID=UPI00057F5746|nr:hypothetical protein [Leisingera sp. ANG-DT]KIC19387.1 hypothetical protein RA21_02450 [Leisingera sp. ANG-DT]
MTTDQLAEILKDRYLNAEQREMVTAIHLFGIEFAAELQGHSANDVAELGTGKRSYGTEVRKGMRLSKFVQIKSGA